MNSVNEQFMKAVESLGCSQKDLMHLDTRKKVQTIASLYTVPERKSRIRECLEELRGRHSLISLLFLRYAVEAPKGASSVWECFVNNGGLSVLEYGFESTNPGFLDSLMEFVIFVMKTHGKCSTVLGRVLSRYELIDKKLVHAYLGLDVDRSALMHSAHRDVLNATCTCSLFIKRIVDDILKMDRIGNELDFLLKGAFGIDQLVNREYFMSLEGKFADRTVFERVSSMLGPASSAPRVASGSSVSGCKGSQEPASIVLSDVRCKMVSEMPKYSRAPSSEVLLERRIKEVPEKNDAGHQHSNAQVRHAQLPTESRALEMLAEMKLKQERPRFSHSVLDCTSGNTPVSSHGPCTSISPVMNASAAPKPSAVPSPPQTPSAGPKKPRFGGGRFGAKAKPKSVLVSSKTYSGIRWKKTTKSQSVVFSRVSYEESERLFDLAEFDRFECRQEKARPEKPERPQVGNVCMDPKKCYALNIALSRVRMDNRELLERIAAQECENENLVRQLIMYFPTAEEIELIRGSKEQLSRAEMLFAEAQEPKVLHDSLVALRFKFCFGNRSYGSLFDEMSCTLRRIVGSKELLRLFGALLVVGNVLNSNSFNGNAEGFTLNSLESFGDDAVLELLSRKVSKPKLVEELTGCPYSGGDVVLLRCEVSIETAISEFGEVRGMFSKECADQQTREMFSVACRRFDEMIGHYKDAQAYFGESDDRFIQKLERFVRKLRDP